MQLGRVRAKELAAVDRVWAALRVAAVLLERPAAQRSVTRARAALVPATDVRWVVRAVGRFHAVAPGHAARPWVRPGLAVAVAVVWAQQLADEVQAALREGPVQA